MDIDKKEIDKKGIDKKDDFILETPWILWNHRIDDNSWKNSSYKNIYEINNLYDYKYFEEILNVQDLQNTMLFLMREDIFPTWEDPDNRDGCCASFKIPLKNIKNIWLDIMSDIICENIHTNLKDNDIINGISIAPKKEFNIVKIWFKQNIKNIEEYIHLKEYHITKENCRMKKNI